MIGWIRLKIYSWQLKKKLRAAKTPEEIRAVADWAAEKCNIPSPTMMEKYYEANGAASHQGSLKDLQEITKRAGSLQEINSEFDNIN